MGAAGSPILSGRRLSSSATTALVDCQPYQRKVPDLRAEIVYAGPLRLQKADACAQIRACVRCRGSTEVPATQALPFYTAGAGPGTNDNAWPHLSEYNQCEAVSTLSAQAKVLPFRFRGESTPVHASELAPPTSFVRQGCSSRLLHTASRQSGLAAQSKQQAPSASFPADSRGRSGILHCARVL
jgi:hypothetical protein